ncbi:MAG: hypothetical protein M1480_12995 [Bacteroidetes bacterium]|nr:hypothetical protein [Bacteroidota bacterium]
MGIKRIGLPDSINKKESKEILTRSSTEEPQRDTEKAFDKLKNEKFNGDLSLSEEHLKGLLEKQIKYPPGKLTDHFKHIKFLPTVDEIPFHEAKNNIIFFWQIKRRNICLLL